MTVESELIERLQQLLAEAKAAGVEQALQPILKRALEDVAAKVSGVAETSSLIEVPGSYGLIGASAAMEQVFELIERVAPSTVPVLILGETGTGKELVARALHENSPRRSKLFLAENCAAVPAELLEGELFGHVKGAFTGAVANRDGHFVAANHGTVFLDEIGDMPLPMQSKLLRVLQEGEVRAVGSNKTVTVDVRVVAATNKDLPAMVSERNFREDLYYRLNVITISLPPLRDREGDVSILARFFADRLQASLGRSVELDAGALAALEAWSWPGNVRELENEIERAVALSDGVIGREDFSPRILAQQE